jgi:hypothetical protein
MDFNEVGPVWRREGTGEYVRTRVEELSAARARSAKIDHKVRRRDRLEISLSLIMLPFFAWYAVVVPSALSSLGAGIIAVGLVIIPLRLRMARRSALDTSLPVTAVLAAEVSRLRAQERLLRSVAWWYFAPLLGGASLVVYGQPVPLPSKVLFTLLVLAFGGFGVFINLRSVRLQLRPVRGELESWLADLHDSDLEGTSHEV